MSGGGGQANTFWQALTQLGLAAKPLPYSYYSTGQSAVTYLGHYRVRAQFALVATQAATSRLFEIRNTGSNILVLTALRLSWLQTAAHTAAIEDSLDVYKATGFSAIDNTNTQALTAVVLRTSPMTAAPGGAALTAVAAAGAAAGATGGTVTLAAAPYFSVPQFLLAAMPTGSTIIPIVFDWVLKPNEHAPFFANNEGLVIANRVLLGAAAGSSVYVEAAWAEVNAYPAV